MVLLAIFTIFIGSSLLYSTSQKAIYNKSKFSKWLASYRIPVKVAAMLCFVVAICLLSDEFGIGLSVFYFLLSLMTIKSLMVMLIPFFKPAVSRPGSVSLRTKTNEQCLQMQNI